MLAYLKINDRVAGGEQAILGLFHQEDEIDYVKATVTDCWSPLGKPNTL